MQKKNLHRKSDTPPPEGIPDVTKTIETPAQKLTRGPVFTNRYEIIEELAEVVP